MQERKYFKKALADFALDMAGGDAIRSMTDRGYTVKQIMEQLTFPMPRERVQAVMWRHLLDIGAVLLEEPGSGQGRRSGAFVKEQDSFGRISFRFSAADGDGSREVVFREFRFSAGREMEIPKRSGGALGGFAKRDAKDADTGGLSGKEQACVFSEGGIRGESVCPPAAGKQGGSFYGSGSKGPGVREISMEKGKKLFDYLSEKCGKNGGESSYISCDFGLRGQRDGLQEKLSGLDGRQQDYILGLPWENRICYHRLDRRMREIAAGMYAHGSRCGVCYFLKTGEKIEIV